MSAATVRIEVNGIAVEVVAGASVAAAVGLAAPHYRRSRSGQPRAPLCGMGVCFECRVRIDGVEHQRSCLVPAREGMQVACDD